MNHLRTCKKRLPVRDLPEPKSDCRMETLRTMLSQDSDLELYCGFTNTTLEPASSALFLVALYSEIWARISRLNRRRSPSPSGAGVVTGITKPHPH